MACPRSALPECAARSVLCPLVCDGTLQAEILASFLLSDGAQIVAALLSGTIPTWSLAAHLQDNAFRVASSTLRPSGNSIYRGTNGPRPPRIYFEPTGKRIGGRVELCIVKPSHFLTPPNNYYTPNNCWHTRHLIQHPDKIRVIPVFHRVAPRPCV